MKKGNSKKWSKVYIGLIAANIVFAVIFYLISMRYGNN
ncbi:hypothetical protein JCM19294_142 [Nonlabens tegetincola]|uniref:Uncharacterized protein n=1 Tax=Nonlabens tegetincola TaxID=323273 RepID=A0A090QQ45_9FLAO|nr:hypothetical protein JCM19294_142 [Nonlabens tegetincola]